MSKLNKEQLSFILESAILAPSADNKHRIHFRITDDTIQVHYTEPKFPEQGGYKWVLALLSLGALSENITVSASRFHMGVETVLFPDPAQPCFVMEVCLKPNQVEVDPLWEAITERHTNRQLRFRGPSMSGTDRNELDAAIHVYPACQLFWLDKPTQRNQALRLMRRAETERFHNRLLHEELFSAIRFESGWNSTCQEGLPPGALGVEPPLRVIFAMLRRWPVMRLANLFGAHHMLGFRSCYLPCRMAPHLGLLAVSNINSQSVFESGRAFQRLWLAITKQGRVLQPMPASALYALDKARIDGIPAALQSDLAEGWKTCLGEGLIPLMLFRMGKARPLAASAGRKETADYFVEKTYTN